MVMFVPPPVVLPSTPFTRAMARDAGLTTWQLRQLLEQGRVRRVLHNVYVRSEAEDSVTLRAQAAGLVVNPFVVICDRTAAWLHGVDVLEQHEHEVLPPLETFSLRGETRPQRRGCSRGQRDLAPGDITVVGAVKVTTPLRTALDLGCRLSRRDGLAALDGFARTCGVTRAELEAELPRYRRRRGVVRLRQVVPLVDGRAESPSESWVRLDIADAGLPKPELQWWVLDDDGRPVFRLDLAYPLSKVAVEYDGIEFHGSDEQRAADAARREWLRARGWTVIVVTKGCFKGPALDSWLSDLRRALGL